MARASLSCMRLTRSPRPRRRPRSSMPTAPTRDPVSSKVRAISTARPMLVAQTGRARSTGFASTARNSPSCTCSRPRRSPAAERSPSMWMARIRRPGSPMAATGCCTVRRRLEVQTGSACSIRSARSPGWDGPHHPARLHNRGWQRADRKPAARERREAVRDDDLRRDDVERRRLHARRGVFDRARRYRLYDAPQFRQHDRRQRQRPHG